MSIDHNMPILIVDDYPMLRIIRNLLKQIDFINIEEATDGSMALAMMKQKKFGLVISDWNMQPMTEMDLLKAVRADAQLKSTPSSWSPPKARPRTSSSRRRA